MSSSSELSYPSSSENSNESAGEYLSMSESSSESHNSDFEDEDQLFLPYDEDIEPLATEVESAAYAAQVAEEERQEREFNRIFSEETVIQAWYETLMITLCL
jgi:hypothetical protein